MRSLTESEFASLLVPNTASPQFCVSSQRQCAMKRSGSGREIAVERRDDRREHAAYALRWCHEFLLEIGSSGRRRTREGIVRAQNSTPPRPSQDRRPARCRRRRRLLSLRKRRCAAATLSRNGRQGSRMAERSGRRSLDVAAGRCSARAGGACAGRFPQRSTGQRRLSDQADPLRARLSAGRRERHDGAADRHAARREPRPAARDRQPAGRRRQHRRGDRGAQRARRPHAAARQQRHPRRQREPLPEARLRSAQGFRAGRADRLAAQHPGGASLAWRPTR